MNDLTELLNAIKSEINMVVERHLLPHFEKMKCNNENMRMIETVLHQMPAFQRLERENAELKELLKPKEAVHVPAEPTHVPAEPTHVPAEPTHVPAEPAQPVVAENIIKLEIVETATNNDISESELYRVASLSDKMINHQIENGTDDESEEVETEAEDGVEGAEPLEEEEEEEEEEVEEEEEEEEVEEEEVEEEDGVEGAEPLEEEVDEVEEDGVEGAEPLEEEEEEVEEEEEEEEEDGVEGAEPLEEEEEEDGVEGVEGAEPLEEDGVEGAEPLGVEGGDPLEEEVSLIEIKGHGQFYTNNAMNGDIYKIDADEEVGDQVGKFVKGVAIFA